MAGREGRQLGVELPRGVLFIEAPGAFASLGVASADLPAAAVEAHAHGSSGLVDGT